ncbi:unnamed protein product [Ranitomeya imitator]|uniref:Ig-like domain-containing protein n=1 Tax=Ranitomeya imitator TaxID=111125 RepID=A0ABN9LV10_9NEOB|nr:unnamed protein product [Ranitomeya imitator]
MTTAVLHTSCASTVPGVIIITLNLLLNNATYDNRHNANLSEPAILRCEVVNNIDDESLIWYRGTGQVDIKSENSVNVSSICIPELTIEDNGVSFTCLLKQNTSIKLSLQMNVLCESHNYSDLAESSAAFYYFTL